MIEDLEEIEIDEELDQPRDNNDQLSLRDSTAFDIARVRYSCLRMIDVIRSYTE